MKSLDLKFPRETVKFIISQYSRKSFLLFLLLHDLDLRARLLLFRNFSERIEEKVKKKKKTQEKDNLMIITKGRFVQFYQVLLHAILVIRIIREYD